MSHPVRKLAVLLHADIVGSTALVQINEEISHERIQYSFGQLSRIIANYGGVAREIRGDALVAEFGRASDSVCAALAFQAKNSAHNTRLTDEIQPEFRIGISLGEVVTADGTITGSGVVLAQRLEQLAAPNSVVVQGSVSETVPVRLPFAYENLGEKILKGFDQPVRAFGVQIKSGERVPEPEADAFAQLTTSDHRTPHDAGRRSIAVLPFQNMSRDPAQEYFSDAITEDVITELSRSGELLVIARNSSFAFKNQSVDISEIGKKLGVQYIVEGSVQTSGKRARITAQLIDTSTNKHLWADRYDRDLEDIFEVQDDVVRTITATLLGRVVYAHLNRIQQKSTSNLNAYDWFVKGRECFYQATPDEGSKASEMFKKAVALDPNYAAAYALLAESYIRDWVTFWNEPPEKSYPLAWEYAKKAVTLDNTDSRTQTALGVTFLYSGDLDQACFHLQKALSLNQSDSHALVYMARCDEFLGDFEKSIERVTQARHHNPFGRYDWSLVPAYYLAQRYTEAINIMQGIQNSAPMQRCWLAAAYAQTGDTEKARDIATEVFTEIEVKLASIGVMKPQNWLDFTARRWPFRQDKDMNHFLDGLRKAGLKG